MTRKAQADGTVLFTSGKQTMILTRLRAGTLLVTSAGLDEGLLFDELSREFETEFAAHGPLTVFADARGAEKMTPVARDKWSEWLPAHIEMVRVAHVLVRSKMMEMAISVIAMFSKRVAVNSYSDERLFTAQIALVVPGFTRLPTIADPNAPRGAKS